jgi:hypothetical protein
VAHRHARHQRGGGSIMELDFCG